MNIPKRYAHARFDNYRITNAQQKAVMQEIQRWGQNIIRDGGYGNMLMLGNPGTGKGHLACATLRLFQDSLTGKRIEQARSGNRAFKPARCLYTTASRALRSITNTYGGEGQTETAWQTLNRADLLVIDEVGVGSNTDFARDTLAEIIDERSAELRPTIVISNLDRHELEQFLDIRAIDRLLDGFSCLLPFTWSSYRQSGKDTVAAEKEMQK